MLPVVATACGGSAGKSSEAPSTTSTGSQADRGKAVVDLLLAAARREDAAAIWALLSKPSRERLGPTLAAFRAGPVRTIEQDARPFQGAPLQVAVSQRISDRFGVVAITRGRHAFAVPLRLENGSWKVEIPGPVKMDILGPQPGSRGRVGQVAVEVHARGGVDDALIYVDGQATDSKGATSAKSATVFTNLPGLLKRGRHTAVAFAQRGTNAGARAWVFYAT